MPTSIDPPPREDELECARCGAYFYYGLTRCPKCGVNIYEPEEEINYESARDSAGVIKSQDGIVERIKSFLRQVFNKPYSAEEIFGDGLDQAVLYNDLLQKVRGDRATVERLVEFEQEQEPNGTRRIWLQNAIERWDRDNRIR